MIKYIIFDLDGTLVNSIYDLADSTNYVLEKNGYKSHPVESYNYFVGDGTLKLIERALPESSRNTAEIERVHGEFINYYQTHYNSKTVPYDGIADLLKALDGMKIKYSVASNKPDVFTKVIIRDLFENARFDKVMGKKEGNPTKPDPKIVYDILSGTSVRTSEVLMVGDSNVDIKTGKNAGIKTVGCLWGFRDEEELLKAGADYIISAPSELLKILNNL